MEVYFKILTVASIAFANTTAIVTKVVAIVGPPSLLLAAITIVVKIDVSHKCYIFYLFCFGNDDGESNCKGNNNDDRNGNSNDLSSFV